jgi:hypothetical protein
MAGFTKSMDIGYWGVPRFGKCMLGRFVTIPTGASMQRRDYPMPKHFSSWFAALAPFMSSACWLTASPPSA